MSVIGLVVFVVAFGLNVVNANIGGQSSRAELATIVASSPSGYRRPSYLTVETASREQQTYFPGLFRYFDLQDARAVCVLTYDGGLGWSWSTLDACTDEEIEASALATE